MIRRSLAILAAATVLSACASRPKPAPEPVVVTQDVAIAVSEPCKAEVPKVGPFPADVAPLDQDIFEQSKTLLNDRDAKQAVINELLAALRGCRGEVH